MSCITEDYVNTYELHDEHSQSDIHHTFTGFFQVGITALANLTARYAAGDPPRTFFSLDKV